MSEQLQWLKAKLERTCSLCGGQIAVGDRIFPQEDEHGAVVYVHLGCAKRAQLLLGRPSPEAPVCKHLRSKGFCLYADRCIFRHPKPATPASNTTSSSIGKYPGDHSSVPAGAAASAAAATAASHAAGRYKRRPRNRFRAGAFRRFLLDTFGREKLREGSGVLDVAGGKGELAFELVNLNSIQATVVEPRPLDLQRQVKWLEAGFYSWNSAFLSYNDRPWTSGTGQRQAEQQQVARAEERTEQVAPQAKQQQQQAANATEQLGEQVDSLQMAGSKGDNGGYVLPLHLRLVVTPQLAACVTAAFAQSRRNDQHSSNVAPGSSTNAAERCAAPPAMPAEWPTLLAEAQRQARESRWASAAVGHEPEEGTPSSSSRAQQQQHQQQQQQDKQQTAAGHDGDTAAAAAAAQHLLALEEKGTPLEISGPAGTDVQAVQHPAAAGTAAEGPAPRPLSVEVKEEACDAAEAAWRQLTCCSVVAGMHPDQATDFIVDLALAAGKPFAVVPCCVHASQFPRRRVNGRPVQSYEDLIEYLVAKDPQHVRVASLPFEGRNTVVYRPAC